MNSRGEAPPGSRPDRAIDDAAAHWFARRDAGLTADEEHALQRWLEADRRHRAAFERLDSAWSTFGKPARSAATGELLEELAGRAARRRRRRLGALAASVMILLAATTFWHAPRRADVTPSSVRTATLLVPTTRVLADGSVVTLKNGAEIAEAFTSALRRIELKRGEALFEVKKDPARPFVVRMHGVEVRAVGTAFTVQEGESGVEVLVTEGTVAVARETTSADKSAPPTANSASSPNAPSVTPSAAQPETTAVLVPAGKRIVVKTTPDAPPPQVAPVAAAELDERLAWRNPRVEFSGTPLAEAIALLNREAAGRSAVQLVIDDPAIAGIRVSGIFRTDNTDAFVLLLDAGFGIRANRSGNTISLRKAAAASPD